MFKRHAASWLIAIGTLAGCGEGDRIERFISDTRPANLRDPAMAAAVSFHSDPRGLLAQSYMPVSRALQLSQGGDTDCPRLIDASDVQAGIADWRIEGRCTLARGETTYRYHGVITASGSGSTTEIRYQRVLLAQSRSDECDGLEEVVRADGVVRLPFLLIPPQDGAPEREPSVVPVESWFEIHGLFSSELIDQEACTTKTIQGAYDLAGTFRQELKPDDPHSSKNNVYTIEGMAAVRSGPVEPQYNLTVPDGAWFIAADDYAFASGGWCEGPVGGTLRLEAGGDVVVIHGDAALSCDGWQDRCAHWSLNGIDQPDELCKISWRHDGCSAGPDTPLPWAALALLLGALLCARLTVLRRARPSVA